MNKIMVKELIVATGNKGKLKEIRGLLENFNIKITSLSDYKDLPEIVEDGKTFRSNAIKKAVTISKVTDKLVMGEDSGIEVKALNSMPGVYSARFSGKNANDKKNNKKMLRLMRGVPKNKRQARYRCFIALAYKGEVIGLVNGSCSGLISFKERGTNGFGYDSLFLIPKYDMTFGELTNEIKARMSHRYRALKKLKESLKNYFFI